MNPIKKISEWWHGKFTPYESPEIICGHYERHWAARYISKCINLIFSDLRWFAMFVATVLCAVFAFPSFYQFIKSKSTTETTEPKQKAVKNNLEGEKPLDTHHNKQPPSTILKKTVTAKVFTPTTTHPIQKTDPLPPIQAIKSNVFSGTNNGVVNQTYKDEFPEPEFDFKDIKTNSPEHGAFVTETILTITAKTALKNLNIKVKAPSITLLKVSPQRSGIVIFGHSRTGENPDQKLDGMAFTNIPSAYGSYLIKIITARPESIDLTYTPE